MNSRIVNMRKTIMLNACRVGDTKLVSLLYMLDTNITPKNRLAFRYTTQNFEDELTDKLAAVTLPTRVLRNAFQTELDRAVESGDYVTATYLRKIGYEPSKSSVLVAKRNGYHDMLEYLVQLGSGQCG